MLSQYLKSNTSCAGTGSWECTAGSKTPRQAKQNAAEVLVERLCAYKNLVLLQTTVSFHLLQHAYSSQWLPGKLCLAYEPNSRQSTLMCLVQGSLLTDSPPELVSKFSQSYISKRDSLYVVRISIFTHLFGGWLWKAVIKHKCILRLRKYWWNCINSVMSTNPVVQSPEFARCFRLVLSVIISFPGLAARSKQCNFHVWLKINVQGHYFECCHEITPTCLAVINCSLFSLFVIAIHEAVT